MQTFLPYPSFADTAKCLDRARLGKQRIEVLQIYRALRGESKGWVNHPAAKMWEGYSTTLLYYGLKMCEEWVFRWYNDTTGDKLLEYLSSDPVQPDFPFWLGNAEFHASHRSNLLRKDPIYYGRFGWTEPHDLSYVWPIKDLK